MYPVFEGEEAFCLECMKRYSSCEICGDTTWNRGFGGFFEGSVCFHYRNLLVHGASHMIKLFDSADHSFHGIPHEGTPAVTEIDEPLPPLLMEKSLHEIDSLSNIFHQKTSDRDESNAIEDVSSKFAKRITASNSHNTTAKRKSTARTLLRRQEKKDEGGQLVRRVRPRVSAPLSVSNSLGF